MNNIREEINWNKSRQTKNRSASSIESWTIFLQEKSDGQLLAGALHTLAYSCVHVSCNRVSSWWRLCSDTRWREQADRAIKKWSINLHGWTRLEHVWGNIPWASFFGRDRSWPELPVCLWNWQLVRPLQPEGEASMEMLLGLITVLHDRENRSCRVCWAWMRATVLGQRLTWLAHDVYPGSSWMMDQVVRYRREHRVIW